MNRQSNARTSRVRSDCFRPGREPVEATNARGMTQGQGGDQAAALLTRNRLPSTKVVDMKAFPRFIASTGGRWLHAVAGTALIIWGVTMGGTGGIVVGVIGDSAARRRQLRLLRFRSPVAGAAERRDDPSAQQRLILTRRQPINSSATRRV